MSERSGLYLRNVVEAEAGPGGGRPRVEAEGVALQEVGVVPPDPVHDVDVAHLVVAGEALPDRPAGHVEHGAPHRQPVAPPQPQVGVLHRVEGLRGLWRPLPYQAPVIHRPPVPADPPGRHHLAHGVGVDDVGEGVEDLVLRDAAGSVLVGPGEGRHVGGHVDRHRPGRLLRLLLGVVVIEVVELEDQALDCDTVTVR